MRYNLPDRVVSELSQFAIDNNISSIVLFGSRARGDNRKNSDIDIAVSGGEFDTFFRDVNEKMHTLISFDIVDYDKLKSGELKAVIDREGVIIYEKI